jgi:hypothetical protein
MPRRPVFLWILSAPLLAQSSPLRFCSSDALNVAFQATDGPDHTYALTLNLRNISAEIEASDGRPVPCGDVARLGHGFFHSFTPGVVFPIELTLSQMGFHPDRPNLYTVVAI